MHERFRLHRMVHIAYVFSEKPEITRGRNLVTVQAVEEFTDMDQASAFHNWMKYYCQVALSQSGSKCLRVKCKRSYWS